MKNLTLLPLYVELKPLLETYVPPLVTKTDVEGRYEIVSDKKVVVNGRTFEEVYFAALIVQKSYVGFYSMACYLNPNEQIPENLKKCLKGKTCFHIKKLDENLKAEIEKLLKQDFDFFSREGYFG